MQILVIYTQSWRKPPFTLPLVGRVDASVASVGVGFFVRRYRPHPAIRFAHDDPPHKGEGKLRKRLVPNPFHRNALYRNFGSRFSRKARPPSFASSVP